MQKEALRFELEIIRSSKRDGRPGIVLLPGAKEAITSINVSILLLYLWQFK